MIAVTGTNGKTTTTHIIAHILRQQGYKVGVIGTLHWLINEEAYPIRNTTPDVITLQKILYRMEKAGVTHVSMEVSSHALSLNRIAGCEFDTAIFTNLTQDHLDYHKTMESYAETKARLFSLVSADKHSKPLKSGIINIDDSYATIMKSFVNKKTFCPLSVGRRSVHARFPHNLSAFLLLHRRNGGCLSGHSSDRSGWKFR